MPTFAGDTRQDDKIALSVLFGIEIGGELVATFSECSGIGVTLQTEKVEEGGLNYTTHKLPGRADFSNITLKRGITKSTDLLDWVQDVMRGKRKRQNISIHVFNADLEKITSWQFVDAFPVKWTGPSLQSTSNAIAVETLELAHEGFVEA